MHTATFRFYADLNDLLPKAKRQTNFAYSFNNDQTVKHLIESAGVPHPEVELIVVNGDPVNFSYLVQDGDQVSVYPMISTLTVPENASTEHGRSGRLRPPPPSPARFVLDIHLGQLARYLRLLGFDTVYPDYNHDDADLAQIAHDENRIMLTRDRGLLKRNLVTHGYTIRTKNPQEQLTAVLHRYHLFDHIQDTPRCLRCNGLLKPVTKEAIINRLEPKTKLYYDTFHMCTNCEQIYWQGSHYPKLKQFVESIKNGSTATDPIRS